MGTITTFKRMEFKYLITTEQKDIFLHLYQSRMVPDEYGKYTLYNLYYDTKDYVMIRRSIEKPVYKEKLRARSYGKMTQDDTLFLEIKKKYKSIVYKRRISLKEEGLEQYFSNQESLVDTQIGREIQYFKLLYNDIAPRVLIAYQRTAYFGKEREDLRITFDDNIVWRDKELSLRGDMYGTPILEQGQVLMEIKANASLPLWLTGFLTEHKIYKRSFSKYAKAYQQILLRNKGVKT